MDCHAQHNHVAELASDGFLYTCISLKEGREELRRCYEVSREIKDFDQPSILFSTLFLLNHVTETEPPSTIP